MGRHKKAPVGCPCSQLAALHGAPWTLFVTAVANNVAFHCFAAYQS